MIYNKLKEALLKGASLNLLTDTIKVALMTQAYVPSESDEFFSQIQAHQVVSPNYVAGGQELSNKTINLSSSVITFDADDVTWNITDQIAATHAVVYQDTGDPATSRLITYKDFGQLRTAINQTFTLEWSDKGIFQLR